MTLSRPSSNADKASHRSYFNDEKNIKAMRKIDKDKIPVTLDEIINFFTNRVNELRHIINNKQTMQPSVASKTLHLNEVLLESFMLRKEMKK